jgi:hypothetical protein
MKSHRPMYIPVTMLLPMLTFRLVGLTADAKRKRVMVLHTGYFRTLFAPSSQHSSIPFHSTMHMIQLPKNSHEYSPDSIKFHFSISIYIHINSLRTFP